MADIVVYDPLDPTVANRVTAYHQSANTPDYNSEPNKLVNPDLTTLLEGSVPQKYWKEDTSAVVEMSQAEKDLIDGIVETTDNTQTVLDSVTIADGTRGRLFVIVNAERTDVAGRARFEPSVQVYRDGGSAAFEGPVGNQWTRRSDSGWKVGLILNGNDVEIRVTGKAGHTIKWRCSECRLELDA